MQAVGMPQLTLAVGPYKRLDAQFLGDPQASVDRVDLTRQPEAPHYRLSGMLPKGDRVHAAQNDSGQLISPIKVEIPGGKFVPQYAPTVVGTHNVYDPAGDCNGNFMSSKFQVNNNCYNYACDVATNSFAQPGRKQGLLLDGSNFTPQQVSLGAQKDGLIEIATHALSNEELEAKSKELPPGHFVSLLFSSPDAKVKWPGDYHWVRRDENGTWSQKDGTDQVTNFDYAGHPILDPAASNWTVNEGPMDSSNPADVVIKYKFYSIMFVPDGKVDII